MKVLKLAFGGPKNPTTPVRRLPGRDAVDERGVQVDMTGRAGTAATTHRFDVFGNTLGDVHQVLAVTDFKRCFAAIS